MSRYLAIIDSYKLKQLESLGEIYISPRELNEIFTADPHTANYQDLLEENFYFREIHEKVFLLISLLQERDCDNGLDVSISEIEYIIALNPQAAENLTRTYPDFRFCTLSRRLGIIENFINYNVRKNCSAGIAAMRILMGLCEPPATLNSYNLLDLSTDPARELLIAKHLLQKKTPYYRTNLASRTLLTLITMYRRTVGYPDGDIGYVMDMLEIYHYAVNRSDQTPPGYNDGWMNNPAHAVLMKIHNENPDISFDDILFKIREIPEFGDFLHTLTALYSRDSYILFIYLKSIDQLRKFGISRSTVANVASWCNTVDERELLASWLGSCFGYMKVIHALYDTMDINIMNISSDDEDEDDVNGADRIITSFESGRSAAKNNKSDAQTGEMTSGMSAANDESQPEHCDSRDHQEGQVSTGDDSELNKAPVPHGFILEKSLMELNRSGPVQPVAEPRASGEISGTASENTETESPSVPEEISGQEHVIDLANIVTINDDHAGDPQRILSKTDLDNISFTNPSDDENIGISGLLPDGFFDVYFENDITSQIHEVPDIPENTNFEVIELFSENSVSASQQAEDQTKPDYDSDTVVYAKGVRINNSQIKIAGYSLTFLEGIFQALTITADFSALSVQEIECAVSMLIRTEAPISRECIVKRFAHICRKTGTPFKNNHKLKVMQEINHVIEKLHCITDMDDFIYMPNKPVFSRNRKIDINRIGYSQTSDIPSDIRYSTSVSRQEIIATIRLIKADDNLGLGGIQPTAEDVCKFMGLLKIKNSAQQQKETDRINRIIGETERKSA